MVYWLEGIYELCMIWYGGVEENGYMHVHDQLIACIPMHVRSLYLRGRRHHSNKQKEVQLLQLVQYIVSGFEWRNSDIYYLVMKTSIIRDYKLAKCLGGERRGEEREEICSKRTSDFDTWTKKFYEIDRFNTEELTALYRMGQIASSWLCY
jgi:hypothetical protein